MGREIRRVPVDFDWPINETWQGFLMPDELREADCPACGGRGAIDGWRAAEKVIRAAGLDPDVWGICQSCDGHGCIEKYPGQRAEAEEWRPTDPPTGDGWQVWETVSEGSPISPVFPDREGLIGWLMSPAYCWGTSKPLTREQAEVFTESGWAPTFIATDTRRMTVAELRGALHA